MGRDRSNGAGWKRAAGVGLAVAAALCAPAARAAHPLVTDDAGTLGQGVRQVELTAALSRDAEGSGAERVSDHTGEGAAAIGYGLVDSLDLVVGLGTTWSRVRGQGGPTSEAKGVGDLALDLKWRAVERGGFALAVKPGVTLPTGDAGRGLGTGRPCWALTLIASQRIGPVALHANVAYFRDDYARREDREASRLDRLHASVAAAVQVASRLQVVADVGLETSADQASSTGPAYALGGLVLAATDALELDVGVKAGLSAAETDVAGLAGVTFRF